MWEYNYTPDPNELYHYGILGMKWGVRRYQNKDGSYTKLGMERYRKAENEYNSAKKNYNDVKNGGNKTQIKSAKRSMQRAKKKWNSAYKQLSNDYRADKGRELYSKGKTITSNERKRRGIQLGMIAAGYAANNIATKAFDSRRAVLITKKYGVIPMSQISRATIVTGVLATDAILGIKTNYDNQKLRAYYGHSRKAYV